MTPNTDQQASTQVSSFLGLSLDDVERGEGVNMRLQDRSQDMQFKLICELNDRAFPPRYISLALGFYLAPLDVRARVRFSLERQFDPMFNFFDSNRFFMWFDLDLDLD